MKIAIYHDMPSGGGKRALFEIVKGLSKKHDLTCYSLATYQEAFCDLRPLCPRHFSFRHRRPAFKGKPLAYMNPFLENLGLLELARLENRIAAAIDSGGFDAALVTHGVYCKSPFVLRSLKTPHVYYCQEPWRHFYEKSPTRNEPAPSLKQRLVGMAYAPYLANLKNNDRKNARSAQKTLVNSSFSRERIRAAYGIDSEVCYLGVDAGQFCPLKRKKDRQVIAVGRLHYMKGYDFLIESLGRIPEQARPKLCIVADNAPEPEKARIERFAGAKKVRLEIFCGITDEALTELYNESLFAVCPQILEPFGFVPLEAGACGLPTVAVNEGGLKETILHNQTGLLCPRDARQFAEKIEALLGDGAQIEKMGAAARQNVLDHWTWEKTVERVEGFLAAAIAKRRG